MTPGHRSLCQLLSPFLILWRGQCWARVPQAPQESYPGGNWGMAGGCKDKQTPAAGNAFTNSPAGLRHCPDTQGPIVIVAESQCGLFPATACHFLCGDEACSPIRGVADTSRPSCLAAPHPLMGISGNINLVHNFCC